MPVESGARRCRDRLSAAITAGPGPALVRLLLLTLALPLIVLGGPAGAATAAPAVAAYRSYTVRVTPDSGPAGSTFTASLTVSASSCYSFDVGFYLEGAVHPGDELAPLVPMPKSCTATAIVTVPAGWSPGAKHIYATYGVTWVPRGEQYAVFTVTSPPPSPTPSTSPEVPSPSPPSAPSPTMTTTTNPTTHPAPTTSPTDQPSSPPAVAVPTSSTPAPSRPTDPGHTASSAMHRLADLRADDGSTGLSPLWWVGFGAITLAGLLGVLAVRRRMDSYRPEGRHRQTPGRSNASGF